MALTGSDPHQTPRDRPVPLSRLRRVQMHVTARHNMFGPTVAISFGFSRRSEI